MLTVLKDYREIRERLRNPVGARISDERTDILSEPARRRQRIAVIIEQEERERTQAAQDRWNEIIGRLKVESDEAAAIADREEAPDFITMEMIIRVVCGLWRIRRVDLISPRRTAHVTYPRQLGMYICRKHTVFSLPQIGAKFGGRDHTTVLHAFNKIEGLINTKAEKVIQDVSRLRRVLGIPADDEQPHGN